MPAGRPPTPSEAISPGGLLDLPNAFEGESWDRWRAVLRAAWGEPLTTEQETLFREVAGERDPPARPVKELWAMVGRSGGKDSVASAIAVTAALKGFTTRRPGEKTLVAAVAIDRVQAEIVFDYIVSYFQNVPALNALVAHDPRARRVVDEQLSADLGRKMYVVGASDNTLDLTNGARIVVFTNNFRSVRGRSLICAILDEVAFYRSEESANPDKELYDALEPSLARVPGSILIGISTCVPACSGSAGRA
jgi:phage terminase large subunit-like protein